MFIFCRWNRDLKCSGPFPNNFEKYERTLRDLRNTRFGKSPSTPHELAEEFSKPEILSSLGTSLYAGSGRIFNGIQIETGYSNTVFSSPHSISLVKKHLTQQNERFYLMDATFSITPRGVFQQVLIIHIKYGIKVRSIFAYVIIYLFTYDIKLLIFFFFITNDNNFSTTRSYG